MQPNIIPQGRIKAITVKDSKLANWYGLCLWVSKNRNNIKIQVSADYVSYKLADQASEIQPESPRLFYAGEQQLRHKEQLLQRHQRDQPNNGVLGAFTKSLEQVKIMNVHERVKCHSNSHGMFGPVRINIEMPILSWIVDEFTDIRVLELSACDIKSSHLSLITKLPLTSLDIKSNKLACEDILPHIYKLSGLETLNIAFNPIGQQGLSTIIKNLKNLKELHLDSGLPDSCYINIGIHLKNLVRLYFNPISPMTRLAVDQQMMNRLKRTFSRMKIQIEQWKY